MDIKHQAGFSATAMFARYRKVFYCDGKQPHYILFTRIGRGTKRFLVNNVQWGLMDSYSDFDCGDIITNEDKSEKYFLVSKINSLQGDKGEFYKTNCKVNIVRLQDEYDSAYNPIGKSEVIVHADLECVYEDVSSYMHVFDFGLLPDTTRRFIVPADTDIKLLDRIILNGDRMQVNNINHSEFAPFLYVQCKDDTR